MCYIIYYIFSFIIISFLSASTLLSKPTMLQIGLGSVELSRDVIEHLHDFSLHIKKLVQQSRIAAVNNRKSSVQELKAKNDLIQVVSDNFNANINTLYGIKQTNGITTIVAFKTRYSQTKVRRTQKRQVERNQDQFLQRSEKSSGAQRILLPVPFDLK